MESEPQGLTGLLVTRLEESALDDEARLVVRAVYEATRSSRARRTTAGGRPPTRARTAAFLIRMAVDQGPQEFWTRSCPGLVGCPMRAQLLCLDAYAGTDTARRVAAAWRGLSDACHYQTYELAPTVVELRRWHEEASDVVRRMSHGPITPVREGA